MLISSEALKQRYGEYADYKGKIRRETERGNLVKVSRGLYETSSDVDGSFLAGAIYGPSYLSFDYALYIYDMIPEAVTAYTSATFCKGKSKRYDNYFGRYLYRDIPVAAYPHGITIETSGNYSRQIATPEKALCDKLYAVTPVHSVKALRELLFDDLRVDEEKFRALDVEEISFLAPLYGSNNLKLLAKLVKEGRL